MPGSWSKEAFADAGHGIELCWQELGEVAGPPLLMIQGIGAQMIAWPDGFCETLGARGFRVIRFDNRDCGRSTWLTDLGTQSVQKAFAKELPDPHYLLSDMAADAAGLLDALGLGEAHVAGASLGGFVAQTLAIEHPQRVRSLASIMSSSGSGRVGQPTPEALEVLMTRFPDDREGFAEAALVSRRVIGSTALGIDEPAVRETAIRSYDRGYNPEGTQRQLVASICSGDRTARLREVEAPTVVLHGEDDPLINVSGGIATAEAVPGAELITIPRWGHDLPRPLWDRIADGIRANARRAG